MPIDFLIFFILIFLWFASAWDSFMKLTKGRVRKIELENKKLAKKLESWLNNSYIYQIIFKFINYFIITIITLLILDYLNTNYNLNSNINYLIIPLLTAVIVTILLVIISELLIKNFVIKYDIKILIFTMPLIKLLNYSLLYPIVKLINFLYKQFFNTKPKNEEEKVSTEEEILSLLENDDSPEENKNSLEEDEKQMIKGIFELDDTTVKEIMTPRVDVKAIPVSANIDQALKLFISSGHSRIPTYQNSVDEITGIILAKDFLDINKIKNSTLEEMSHKPIYIPETKSTGELLDELKGSHNHFSVVIDEYGGTAGIVTLEDILEEIVGEIHDEHESNRESEPYFTKDGSIILDARVPIDELNEILKIKLPEDDDVDTIGGLICSQLGKIPEPDEELILKNMLNIKILKSDKRRVMTLKVRLINK
ncbi:MAG: HlyC/CorC family transporter [bacterium]|nr:HlyC/CorC family transporter [bacterium]